MIQRMELTSYFFRTSSGSCGIRCIIVGHHMRVRRLVLLDEAQRISASHLSCRSTVTPRQLIGITMFMPSGAAW